jgi:arylsulfatase A-like enzyme
VLGSAAAIAAPQSAGKRPNIVVIHCHDAGRHLGCYGRGVETPHIDSIAAGGVRFDGYFSTAPFCSPSRASRITGLYPVHHGSLGSTSFAWGIKPGIQTTPMLLNRLGYETHLFGLQHEARDVKTLGYTHYEHGAGSPGASTRAFDVVEKVDEFLDRRAPSDPPFYLDVGFGEAHMGVPKGGYEAWKGPGAPPRFKPRYVAAADLPKYDGEVVVALRNPEDPYKKHYRPEDVGPLPYLPDRPGIREDLADLNALITNVVDAAVGRILRKISERGLEDDTLVVFTTDHGIDMPRAKGSLYDPGVEVGLVMRYPRRFPKGKAFSATLSHIDLMPTLVEAAGGAPPENIDGRSFLPLIEGRPYAEREEIFFENTWHGFYDPMRGLRTKKIKYIRNFDAKRVYWAVESKAAREVLGTLCFGLKPLEELYDLEKDPLEQRNLAPARTLVDLMTPSRGRPNTRPADRAYAPTLREMRARLRRNMERTTDLLLKGPSPHPCYERMWDAE